MNINLDPESVQDLEALARQLNTDVKGILGQAVSLLKVAQGRLVKLQGKKKTWEISNYVDKQPLVWKDE